MNMDMDRDMDMHMDVHMYMDMYTSMYMYMCMYVYIYKERDPTPAKDPRCCQRMLLTTNVTLAFAATQGANVKLQNRDGCTQ